ncbi:MAG TPA: 4Fe-4S binding protein [Acidobacteriota bacterium]|nr:4Fe-4S binding protein [Acidobacteriota bacterium]
MYTCAKIDLEKCNGCKLCVFYCPDPNVLMLDASKKISVNESRCKGCGLCVTACTRKAVTIREA